MIVTAPISSFKLLRSRRRYEVFPEPSCETIFETVQPNPYEKAQSNKHRKRMTRSWSWSISTCDEDYYQRSRIRNGDRHRPGLRDEGGSAACCRPERVRRETLFLLLRRLQTEVRR